MGLRWINSTTNRARVRGAIPLRLCASAFSAQPHGPLVHRAADPLVHRTTGPLVLSLSKDARMVRQAHHERDVGDP